MKKLSDKQYISGNIPFKNRFFFWKPAKKYSFPIRIIFGNDKYGWSTFAIITWAGSIFYRIKLCECDDCNRLRSSNRASRFQDYYNSNYKSEIF